MTTKTIYRNFGTFSDRLIDANLETQYREKKLPENVTQATVFIMFALVPMALIFISLGARFILTEDYPDDLLNRLTLNGSILLVILTFLLMINLFPTVKDFQRVVFLYMVFLGGTVIASLFFQPRDFIPTIYLLYILNNTLLMPVPLRLQMPPTLIASGLFIGMFVFHKQSTYVGETINTIIVIISLNILCYFTSRSIGRFRRLTYVHQQKERESRIDLEDTLRELDIAREIAEVAGESKTAFLGNISHEIRTPLNAILGMSELLKRSTDMTLDQQAYLATIIGNGKRLLSLLNNVLEMSELQISRLEPNIQTVKPNIQSIELRDYILQLESIFGSEAARKGLQFEMNLIGEAPKYINTDSVKLQQIVINLVHNAIKFTDNGGVTVRIYIKGIESDEPRLRVEVEDTGIGMTDRELLLVFRHFEQANIGSEHRGGAGMGLSISHEFVNILGGVLTAKSLQGKGSTFGFDIPIEYGDIAELDTIEPQGNVLALEQLRDTFPVLIVDHEEELRSSIKERLEPIGSLSLESVPHELILEMKEATLNGYMDRLRGLLDQVDSIDEAAATTLRDLANHYEYDALIEILENV